MGRINFSWPATIMSLALIYCLAASVLAFMALEKPLIGVDDANITMVYAKNILAGKGIVYNAGQERVEGYSSPLVLLIFCAAFMLSRNAEIILLILNFLFTLAVVFLILDSIRKTAQRVGAAPLTLFFLVSICLTALIANPAYFGRQVISLMDNGLYSLLIIGGFVFLVNRQQEEKMFLPERPLLAGLIALMILSRPEGVVWALLFIVIDRLITARRKGNWSGALKASVMPAAVLFGTMAALLLFRLIYFGYPLPNTYYAKVSASIPDNLRQGWIYLAWFADKYIAIVILLLCSLAVLFALWFFRRRLNEGKMAGVLTPLCPLVLIVAAFILVGLALPVLEGGDIFYDFRLFQNIYPLFVIPLAYLGLAFKDYLKPIAVLLTAAAVNALFFYANPAGWDVYYQHNILARMPDDQSFRTVSEYYIASKSRENGCRLNLLFTDRLPTIGYGSAGGIALTYQGIVYDLAGLNNTKIAHAEAIKSGLPGQAAFNKEVFFVLAPDILMPTAFPGTQTADLPQIKGYYCSRTGFDNLLFKNIFNDLEFKRRYTLAVVKNRRDQRYKCFGFFHNAFLAGLRISPIFEIENELFY